MWTGPRGRKRVFSRFLPSCDIVRLNPVGGGLDRLWIIGREVKLPMKNRILLLYLLCCLLICTQLGCAVPRLLWPQEDIAPSQVTGTAAAQRVLVASRNSEFKNALVDRLKSALQSDGASIEIVGISRLEAVHAKDYSAVVLVGTCIAWGLDPDIQAFLDRQPQQENMIVVTTSGDGTWLPEKKDRGFDAVAAASTMVTVDIVANDVITRIRARLHRN